MMSTNSRAGGALVLVERLMVGREQKAPQAPFVRATQQ